MSLLDFQEVRVEAGGRRILDIQSLQVREHEVLAILGPTGAGKSTLLRVANLIERPVSGRLRFRGEDIHWPAPLSLRRRITMAFQDPLLFSGTTLDNVLYGLLLRGVPQKEARALAMEMLRQLRVDDRAFQAARTLSGGEAHRASLARAVVIRPELLLLDEPLASLDEPIRQELGNELSTLVRTQGLTCVLVTHDQAEARALADRIAVLDDGCLRQVGTPEEVFSRPADPFVARFVGTTNLLPGRIRMKRDGVAEVSVGEQILTARTELAPESKVLVCIRPEEIEVGRNSIIEPGDPTTQLAATVTGVTDQAAAVAVRLDCGFPLVALLPRRVARKLQPTLGERLLAFVPHTAVHIIRQQD